MQLVSPVFIRDFSSSLRNANSETPVLVKEGVLKYKPCLTFYKVGCGFFIFLLIDSKASLKIKL